MPQHNPGQIALGEERRNLVVRLRSQGRTFREIATELCVSTSRANQLYNRALVLQRERQRTAAANFTPETPIAELPISIRAVNSLSYGGYETLGDMLPLDRAREQRLLALPNFARVCLNEVQAVVEKLAI